MQTLLRILERAGGYRPTLYLKIENPPFMALVIEAVPEPGPLSKPPPTTLLATIRRAVSGPDRRDLVALPESRNEVETIAGDLPKPSTILLGSHATKAAFTHLPLNEYKVIHLALHGYADSEFPDRSTVATGCLGL